MRTPPSIAVRIFLAIDETSQHVLITHSVNDRAVPCRRKVVDESPDAIASEDDEHAPLYEIYTRSTKVKKAGVTGLFFGAGEGI